MNKTADSAREKLKAIRAHRSARALTGLLTTVGVLLVMFGSFALGYQLGPSDLPATEVLVGVTGVLSLGIAIAWSRNRARLERGAKWIGDLREGRRRRRVALFDEYLTVDREIVVTDTVERAELEGESLVLRYVDPIAEGPVLRELSGPRADLARLAHALRPADREG